jgi:predicted alternative tryptophan synthase beta-subunit
MSDTIKYTLDESSIPKTWYNLVADLPKPPPPVLHPGTGQPIGPAELAPLFPMALIAHGHFDMHAYTDHFAGKLQDRSHEEASLERALAELPKL